MLKSWPFVKKNQKDGRNIQHTVFTPITSKNFQELRPEESSDVKESNESFVSLKASAGHSSDGAMLSTYESTHLPTDASSSNQQVKNEVLEGSDRAGGVEKKAMKDEDLREGPSKMDDSPSKHEDMDVEDNINDVDGKASRSLRGFLKLVSYYDIRKLWQSRGSKSSLKLSVRRQIEEVQKRFALEMKDAHSIVVIRVQQYEKQIGVNRKEKEEVERDFQDWMSHRRNEYTRAVFGNLTTDDLMKMNVEMAKGENVQREKIVGVAEENRLKEKYKRDLRGRLADLTKTKFQYYAEEVRLRRKMQEEVKEHEDFVMARRESMLKKIDALRNPNDKKGDESSRFERHGAGNKSFEGEKSVESVLKKINPLTDDEGTALSTDSVTDDVGTQIKEQVDVLKDEASESEVESRVSESGSREEDTEDRLKKEEIKISMEIQKIEGVKLIGAETIPTEKDASKDGKASDKETSGVEAKLRHETDKADTLKAAASGADDTLTDPSLELKRVKGIEDIVAKSFDSFSGEEGEKTEEHTEGPSDGPSAGPSAEQTEESKERFESDYNSESNQSSSDEEDEEDKDEYEDDEEEEDGVKERRSEAKVMKKSIEDLLKVSRSEGESRNMLDLSPRMNPFKALFRRKSNFYLPDPSNEEELRYLIPKPEEHLVLYNNLLIKLFFKNRSYQSKSLSYLQSKNSAFSRSLKRISKTQRSLNGDLRSLRKLAEEKDRSEEYKAKQLERIEDSLTDLKLSSMKAEKIHEFLEEATEVMMDLYQTDLECLEKAYKVVQVTGVKSMPRYSKKRFLKSFVSQAYGTKRMEEKLKKVKKGNDSLQQDISLVTDTYFIKKSMDNLVS